MIKKSYLFNDKKKKVSFILTIGYEKRIFEIGNYLYIKVTPDNE